MIAAAVEPCARALGLVGLVSFDFLVADGVPLPARGQPAPRRDARRLRRRAGHAVSAPTSRPAAAATRVTLRPRPPPGARAAAILYADRGPLTRRRDRLAGLDRRPAARPARASPATSPSPPSSPRAPTPTQAEADLPRALGRTRRHAVCTSARTGSAHKQCRSTSAPPRASIGARGEARRRPRRRRRRAALRRSRPARPASAASISAPTCRAGSKPAAGSAKSAWAGSAPSPSHRPRASSAGRSASSCTPRTRSSPASAASTPAGPSPRQRERLLRARLRPGARAVARRGALQGTRLRRSPQQGRARHRGRQGAARRPSRARSLPPAASQPSDLTILYAPTGSLAGTVQIAARVLEVALHKAHALHFPLEHIVDGIGTAPIAPPIPDFVKAMGRTNDAIIYGGRVQLFVRGADDAAKKLADELPSQHVLAPTASRSPRSSPPSTATSTRSTHAVQPRRR